MFLKQYYLGCLAHASYLVADEASACAIVVDPQRDIQQYLTDAERLGALAERQDLVRSTERVGAWTLAEELASENPPFVLDIRAPREWSAKHLGDSTNLPLAHLRERIQEVPRNRRIAVHCAGGYRSSIAVGILNQHGIANLIELAGGIAAWEAAKFPVITG